MPMQPIDVLRRFRAAPSRLEQEQVLLEAFTAGCHVFFIGMRLSADPFYTFGLNRVAMIYEDTEDSGGTFSFAAFEALAARLYGRLDDAAIARAMIHRAAEHCDGACWNEFYRRILLKTLHSGLDLRLFSRIYKRLGDNPEVASFMIPQRFWQRSQPASATQAIPADAYLIDGCMVGERLLAVLDTASTISFHTAKAPRDCPALHAALRPLFERLPGSLVFDGVLHDGRYTIFDILPFAAYKIGGTDQSQRQRHATLVAMQEAGCFAPPLAVLPKLDFSGTITDLATIQRQMANDGYLAMFLKRAAAGYDGSAKSGAWRKISTSR